MQLGFLRGSHHNVFGSVRGLGASVSKQVGENEFLSYFDGLNKPPSINFDTLSSVEPYALSFVENTEYKTTAGSFMETSKPTNPVFDTTTSTPHSGSIGMNTTVAFSLFIAGVLVFAGFIGFNIFLNRGNVQAFSGELSLIGDQQLGYTLYP